MKGNRPEFVTLPPPAGDIAYFQAIKEISNKYWLDTDISNRIYGYQIQTGTKWRPGLTEKELTEFESEIGYGFPIPLRNFYLTMNGLDKPGINVYGQSGNPSSYRPIYYSYPDDIDAIKSLIHWVLSENGLAERDLPGRASRFFPVMSHRCILIDEPDNPVLSMHGNDIIYWSDNLAKFLATDIFSNIYNASDFENDPEPCKPRFWLD
jgi:hypothetical protein